MLTLQVLNEAQTRDMYPWIRDNFPADECRPLRMMLKLMKRGLYEAIGFYDDGQPVGYALSLLPQGNPSVLLDYLVVDAAQRGRGIGSIILSMLRTYYAPRADAILIESEHPASAPDQAVAARRIRFYQRTGAILFPFRVLLFGVDYAILALPTGKELPAKDWSGIILDVYHQTLPALFYASQVHLIPPPEETYTPDPSSES